MSEKIYTIEEIKKILSEILKDKPVYQVILFGSYAKKNATKDSDRLNNRYKVKIKGLCTAKINMSNWRKITKRNWWFWKIWDSRKFINR